MDTYARAVRDSICLEVNIYMYTDMENYEKPLLYWEGYLLHANRAKYESRIVTFSNWHWTYTKYTFSFLLHNL